MWQLLLNEIMIGWKDIVGKNENDVLLDENDKIDLNKFSTITYDPVYHTYRKICDAVSVDFRDEINLRR